jgi:hypothetical protein
VRKYSGLSISKQEIYSPFIDCALPQGRNITISKEEIYLLRGIAHAISRRYTLAKKKEFLFGGNSVAAG